MTEKRSGFTRSTSWKKENSGKRENLRIEGSLRRQEEPDEAGQAGTDYRIYRLSLPERAKAYGIGVLLDAAAAYTCYRSMAVFLILLIPAAAMPAYMREIWKKRRLRQLELQFKETIQLIAASLGAGLSVENAIIACARELKQMYGEDGMMYREMTRMAYQMSMNRPVEELMTEFAERSGLEEAENFAGIFRLAKRSGGQLVPIIRHTVQVMDDRFRVKEEIRTMTASRQFEQKVMNAMPFLIVLYINCTSPGFFDVMYTTAAGRVIMTGCLAVYILSCFLAGKILDISVM